MATKPPKKLSIDDPELSQSTNWIKLQQRWIAAQNAKANGAPKQTVKKTRKESP